MVRCPECASNDPGDLIAIVVQMMDARGAGWQDLLKHHDAAVRLAAEELQREEATWCRRFDVLPTARRYDKALCCAHVSAPPHC